MIQFDVLNECLCYFCSSYDIFAIFKPSIEKIVFLLLVKILVKDQNL